MHPGVTEPWEILHRHKECLGYLPFLKHLAEVEVIEHINYEGQEHSEEIVYSFFKSAKSFWYVPFRTLKYIKQRDFDVILAQGLNLPLQIFFLRLFVGWKPVIIVQHHGERPLTGIKKQIQKAADRFTNAYFFTANGNAVKWLEEGVIEANNKCYEVPEASTYFTRRDATYSKRKLNIDGTCNFLWVGRLEKNKDPLTVLNGFAKYVNTNPEARLYMVYQQDDLLDEIKAVLAANLYLAERTILVGRVAHEELPYWFSAADFYLSGSHREGSGFALIEAIACGCIPIVTEIPPFKSIAGPLGFYYTPGNPNSLCDVLLGIKKTDREKLSNELITHFERHLSFKSIAEKIYNISKNLLPE